MALSINIARGKPDPAQLDLSNGLLNCLSDDDYLSADGTDVRNYSGIDGLQEMKALFGEVLDVKPESVIVGGNSSLNMMFDFISAFVQNGFWKRGDKFICPSPGYDRHFAICEYFGLEMLTVNMKADGPDMDAVEDFAARPETVGMWNVPVFSNPTGCVYSDEVIRGLSAMRASHPYFRLMWDNAYAVHHFRGERPAPLNIVENCEANNNVNRPVLFTSFSKVSFAGGGVSALSASKENREQILKRIAVQTVGPDKINQLRHVRFFKNLNGILSHMEKHAAIMRPKFDLANEIFSQRLSGGGTAEPAAEWTNPDGGYFISLNTKNFRAKRTEELCKSAGLTITGAGATFPYMKDPLDRNLRVAPSFLPLGELEKALNIFCDSVLTAANEVNYA